MIYTSNVTSKGQVTIPKAFRDEYGILLNGEVEFEKIDQGIVVRPPNYEERERKIKAALDKMIGMGDVDLTTDEIMHMTRGDD